MKHRAIGPAEQVVTAMMRRKIDGLAAGGVVSYARCLEAALFELAHRLDELELHVRGEADDDAEDGPDIGDGPHWSD